VELARDWLKAKKSTLGNDLRTGTMPTRIYVALTCEAIT
jgi:hypothetical protein